MERYVKRLVEEWKQHGKIIIAVDYDDTLVNWKMNDHSTYDRVLDILRIAKETGAYIVVFTACNEDRYDEIYDYCAKHGLKVDSINKNPIDLPYGNHAKIYANIFLDDRAGLDESLNILQQAMYTIRGERNTESTFKQIF